MTAISNLENLQVLPIGGLGEIGMNLTLYGVGEDWIAVDAGVRFCEPGFVGADHVLPDLDLIAEFRGRLKAIVVTHAHEDHIGAIQYVVQACPVPVYAPPFACEVLRLKAAEYGSVVRLDLHPIQPDQPVDFGPIQVEWVPVTHSTPDSHALVLRTPVGTIVHAADFKIDPDPLGGHDFATERFRQLGDEGVRLLLADSTNALVPGRSGCDRAVVEELERQVESAPGRAIVSLFASNVFRVRALIDAGVRMGRRVALAGRSLNLYMDAAQRAKLTSPLPDLVDPHQIERVSDPTLLVICTGSQAEPRSVLTRASLGEHPDLRIHAGDRVVLSSRIIPGNERAIFRMMNNLCRLGAHVVNERIAPVHASGHACRDELRDLIQLVRPREFIPIHGEYMHLQAHADLATEAGVPDVLTIDNGHLLEVTRGDSTVIEKLPLTDHYVDGPLVGDAGELKLDERRRMGWTGVVFAECLVRLVRRKWQVDLDLKATGVALCDETTLDDAADFALEQLTALPKEAGRKQFEEALHGSLRSFFRKTFDRKPIIQSFLEFEPE